MKENFNPTILDEGFDPERDKVADLLKKNIIPEVVIHGDEVTGKDGERKLAPRTDLDAKVAVYLLDLAGVEYDVLSFVDKGDSKKGAINIDTGGKKGVIFEEDTQTIYIDHHSKEKTKRQYEDISSSEALYRTLVRGKMLEETTWIEELIILVNEIDNAEFPINRDILKNQWWRSLYGLHNLLSFESLVQLIKNGRRSDHLFTADEAKEIKVKDKKGKEKTLYDLCLYQRKFVQGNIEIVDRLYGKPYIEKNGKIRFDLNTEGIKINTKMLGTVLVNIVEDNKNQMPLGFTLARGTGFDSYVSFHTDNGGFFISCPKKNTQEVFDALKDKYPEAKLIRGVMIVYRPELKDGEAPGRVEDFLRTLSLID